MEDVSPKADEPVEDDGNEELDDESEYKSALGSGKDEDFGGEFFNCGNEKVDNESGCKSALGSG